MTQEELAERSGVAVRTIRSLERNAAPNPQVRTVRLLADALAGALDFRPEKMRQLLAHAPADALGPTPGERQVLRAVSGDAGPDPGPPEPAEPSPPSSPGEAPDPLASAADKLAWQVRERWQREEEHRRVNDPFPLPVRWEEAPGHLTDHWESICNAPPGVVSGPLPLAGDLDKIAGIYRTIPSGRLVVLGRAGSGKTILALRFVLDYLKARRHSTEPVPVIFSIGSWDPTAISLRDWLTGRLLRDYPDLAASTPRGSTQAAALVEEERILPVLDGFDEIAADLRGPALDELSATRLRLLLTSRTAEYVSAAADARGLTRAAGIELAGLTPMDLSNYLPRTAPRTKAGQDRDVTGTAWAPVIKRLAEEPESLASASLAAALSTPLMVALARAIYSDRPGHDPEALLDTTGLPTAEAIEEHLLSRFVPTVYRHRPPPQSGAAPPRRHRNWDPDRARHWLGNLARHLDHAGDHDRRDLAWWQLGSLLRPSTRILAVTLATTLATAVADWLVILPLAIIQYGAAFGLRAGLVDGLVTGPPVGVAFGLIYALMTTRNKVALEPSRMRLRLPRWREEARGTRGRRYASWGGAGFLGGLVVGAGFGPARTLERRLLYGTHIGTAPVIQSTLINMLCFGLIFAMAGGIALGLVTLLETPLDTGTAATPASLLAANRTTVLRQVLVTAPVLAVVIGVGGWVVVALLQGLVGPLSWPLSGGIVVGIVGGVSIALSYALAFTAWGQWMVLSRVTLPLAGRLPWALPRFLDDAYQRGVLRQAGAVYQFRHARLQRHLSQACQPAATGPAPQASHLVRIGARPSTEGAGTRGGGRSRDTDRMESCLRRRLITNDLRWYELS
jgi:transcriptional regulator with XRE-family HTH domain